MTSGLGLWADGVTITGLGEEGKSWFGRKVSSGEIVFEAHMGPPVGVSIWFNIRVGCWEEGCGLPPPNKVGNVIWGFEYAPEGSGPTSYQVVGSPLHPKTGRKSAFYPG